ncbi:hypothetical protein RDWZM_002319 [Blomia tropicalis]|uniref:Protein kinase domain-containing protein n=1 Tax=Blomia tropicalis TaxID=40697 RepID=A0A9Q0ME49_BLOTA|nr:hypothetical protein BLOT_001960 [Blomia tropicalis]KAJ6223774.1 hypothetical protein RDWZM_002319 [Blomia tropicalis]
MCSANATNNKRSNINLELELSEVDRAFWLVLDMAFSQGHTPADFGVYYECECEDTFSFNRLQNASQRFPLFLCNQALKPNIKLLVKYVNAVTDCNDTLMANIQTNAMMGALRQEYELMIKLNRLGLKNSGILDVYCFACTAPNVYYMFVEKPDLTLNDYIRLHSTPGSNHSLRKITSSTTTVLLNPHNMAQQAPLRETKFILGSLASTILQFHASGIVHGSLSSQSVFLFTNTSSYSSSSISISSNCTIDRVKLGNFTFATYLNNRPQTENENRNDGINRNKSSQSIKTKQKIVSTMAMDEMMRCKDVSSLYTIAMKMAEITDYQSSSERDSFQEAIRIIEIDQTKLGKNKQTRKSGNKNGYKNEVKRSSTDRLEFFAEAMWEE